MIVLAPPSPTHPVWPYRAIQSVFASIPTGHIEKRRGGCGLVGCGGVVTFLPDAKLNQPTNQPTTVLELNYPVIQPVSIANTRSEGFKWATLIVKLHTGSVQYLHSTIPRSTALPRRLFLTNQPNPLPSITIP